jgi:TolB-like protein
MAGERSESRATDGSLESWKAIASYLHREVRTVQRWERDEGLPVHRHEHKKQATVYAYQHEIDDWRANREKQGADTRSAARRLGVAALLLLGAVAVLAVVANLASRPSEAPVAAGKRLIIVLPFADLSQEPLTPMADALTEEISTRLAASDPATLAVIARASAMSFKSRQLPVDEMREQLNVDYALEGSIRHDDGIIRVAAQLVETAGQSRVWSGNFAYPMGSWLDVQLKASSDILAQIGSHLDIAESDSRVTRATEPEAYEHTLLGYHYFDQSLPPCESGLCAATESGNGPATLPDAIAHFNAALELDADFVDAQIGLALSHATMAFFGAAPAAESYRELERWAFRALELDENNGEALALLGWVEFVYRWNWEEAERAMRDGVARQPNSPWTHWLLANYLSAMDRPEEAIASIDAAIRLDPVSPYVLTARGYILSNAGLNEETLRHWAAARERLGNTAVLFRLEAHENVGDFDAAVRLLEELGHPMATALRQGYESDGERGYWRALAESIEDDLAEHPDQFSYRYVVALSKLGEAAAAIDVLERGYNLRAPAMVFLPIYPLQPLYADPRFKDLVQRMNLPPPVPRQPVQ